MKVESRTRIGTASVRRPSQAGGSGATFSASPAADSQPARAVSGSGPLAAVDALLAVQEADAAGDFRGSKRRAVNRAEDILDLLDAIKLGILTGEVPGPKLSALLRAVESHRDMVADPELAEILDHVELRARVELAKFGR
ncbi:flagellar assembly protein FliX [Tepidicaulis sp. LMO-SS28]|uniref:flagellar assembly protein FliX n=1 Tax=Tepidicaulis sp. LMO-SS28 TaxID=3447455 RepID=UPI003EE25A55